MLGVLLLLFAFAGHIALLVAARVAVTRALPHVDGRALAFAKAGAGVTGFWIATAIATTAGLVVAGEWKTDETSMRVAVHAGGPADRAGVRKDDRVLSVDGAPVTDWPGLRAAVAAKGSGTPIVLGLERDGRRLDVPVTPEGTPPKILVGPRTEHVDVGVGTAIGRALVQPIAMVGLVAKAARRSMQREQTELAGPVAVASGAQESSASVASGRSSSTPASWVRTSCGSSPS